jgi:hypothetical protein
MTIMVTSASTTPQWWFRMMIAHHPLQGYITAGPTWDFRVSGDVFVMHQAIAATRLLLLPRNLNIIM